jgi:DNA-binding CsgD family transcriptional regulator
VSAGKNPDHCHGGDSVNPASRSSFVGRAPELRDIAEALRSSTSAGAVLVGVSGIGKTALLQNAIAQAQTHAYVVRLRGSAAMASSPYSAMNSLLTGLDDEQVAHPVTMLRALSALLRARGAGRTVVLAIDNVELLDGPSATIISQLVSIGAVKILLTARRFHLADVAFMALWRKGSLLRLDVEAFSLKESALFCESELGAYVSSDVVRTAHRLSGGSPKLLSGCLRELQRQGLLVQGATSWVLRPGVAAPCRESAAATIAHIDALGPACRSAAILVALSGGLPLSALLEVTSFAAVDALQDAGLITVGKDLESTVRCVSSVGADGIRLGAGQEDALAAYELAQQLTGAWGIAQLRPHHHAAWRRKAGLPLDAELVARAARRLNDHGKYADVLELASDAGKGFHDAVLVEMLRARVALGDYEGFDQLNGRFAAGAPADPVLAIRVLLMQAEVAQRAGRGTPSEFLDHAEGLLGHVTDSAVAAAISDEVLIGRAELLAFEGRYLEVASMLSPRRHDAAPMTNDTLVRADTLLTEAWSMGVRQLDAMELARTISGFLLENAVTARTRIRAYDQVWETHRTAGEVDGARHIKDITTQHTDEACFAPRSYEEISRALARAYQGHVEDALRILLPTFDQLRFGDPWGVLPAAAAGIAYCYARQHDLQPMIEYLPYCEADSGTPWKIAQTARYFQLLASSHTENRTSAGQDFHKVALQLSDTQGAHYLKMLALFRAVRLGNHDALDALGSISAQLQGPFARLTELYAKGLGSQDTEFLLRSMEMASGMGDMKFAREAAQHALQSALRADDKRALRHVQRQVRGVMPESEEWGTAGARLTGLTRREREVAFAAAGGATNRDIANDMCVSVRTVEGHLYQVYSKLNVSSRAELAELIPAGQVQA